MDGMEATSGAGPATQPRQPDWDLTAGRLELDFANTVEDRPGPRPVDGLTSYARLVDWARAAGLLTDGAGQRLLREAAARPAEAAAVLERALVLREAIYRIFRAVADGQAPEPSGLDVLNAALAWSLPHARVVPVGDGFAWGWDRDDRLDRMLWPIARSAADLLTSDQTSAVRECSAHDCSWLFMDTSRNGSRRWCNMQVCGNRAKARRHQQRKRAMARAAGAAGSPDDPPPAVAPR